MTTMLDILFDQEREDRLWEHAVYVKGYKIGLVLGLMFPFAQKEERTSENAAKVFGITKEEFENWCIELPDKVYKENNLKL